MAELLLAGPVVASLEQDMRVRIQVLAEQGVTPTLALVRVGNRPDDLSYEGMLLKHADQLGIAVQVFALAADATTETLVSQIHAINADAHIHGCLLFRPLPSGVNDKQVCDSLAIEKDIDGISSAALGSIFVGSDEGFAPGTAQACVTTLDHYGISLAGKHVVVIGRSLVIGRPVALLLLHRHATVSICHSRTEHLAEHTRQADIVICATGKARFYDAQYAAT